MKRSRFYPSCFCARCENHEGRDISSKSWLKVSSYLHGHLRKLLKRNTIRSKGAGIVQIKKTEPAAQEGVMVKEAERCVKTLRSRFRPKITGRIIIFLAKAGVTLLGMTYRTDLAISFSKKTG